MRVGDLVVMTSCVSGGWAVRRAVRSGELGLIVGVRCDAFTSINSEHTWWRVLLEDGEVELPEWTFTVLSVA